MAAGFSWRMALRGRVAGVCAGLLVPVGVAAAPPAAASPSGCPVATASTVLAASTPMLDYAENLGYDRTGNLWVSRLYRSVVQRYDSHGRLTGTVAVASPGAIRLGPDGLLYVASGDSSLNLVPGTHSGAIVRFDPAAPAPTPAVFASGLGMPNGAAFDAAGNLYVADTASGVVRVRPDGSVDTGWTARAADYGVNGIVVDGDSVYATEYFSADGRIVRIPIADPSAQATVATVTIGSTGVSALPDDLAVGPDAMLYDATTTGHLVRIDPVAHTTCTVYSGTDPLAAVAPAADGSLTVSTAVGNVLRITLTGK